MAAIPAIALLGQFAGEITPAGQAVCGLKAQPFADDHGAALGEVHDADSLSTVGGTTAVLVD